MDNLGLFAALRRHVVLVAVLTLIGLGVAGLASAALPRTYEARATLFLRVQAASTSLFERSQFALQRVQSYPQLLDSPALLRSVIDSLGLHETTQQLDQQISAENPTNTVLLNITASASTPQSAAAIANAAADALAKNVNLLENNETTSKNAVTLVPEIAAQAPSTASSPNLPVVLGLGVLGGLVIGLLVALLIEAVRPRLRTAEDVRRVLGLPLVAQLPWTETRGRKLAEPSAATETAVANIRALGHGSVPPVVLLAPSDRASARPAIRYLIASGIAETGRRVAVLESDPSASLPGGVDVPPTALRLDLGAAGFSAPPVLRNAAPGGVDVVPIEAAAGTSRFTVEKTFATTLQAVAVDYDATLVQAGIDSTPVSLDMAATATPGAFIVISRSKTNQRAARRVLARLRLTGVVPIGVLMVDAPSRLPDLLETWRDHDLVSITAAPEAPAERVPTSAPSETVAVHDVDRAAEPVKG